MPHLIIIVILAWSSATAATVYPSDIFNKTWLSTTNFGGVQYVFFKPKVGETKVIKQVRGSGVCVVKSEIFDVEIKPNSVILRNGLNLNTGDPVNPDSLHYDALKIELRCGKNQLEIISETGMIFNWATKEICDLVDFEALKKLQFHQNELYDVERIKELSIAGEGYSFGRKK